MRLLWTFAKVLIALVLLVPISIIVLGTTLGILGALVGLAFVALRLAVIGVIAYGVFRLAVALFGRRKRPASVDVRALRAPPVDPYYEVAQRELDRELGVSQ